MDKTIYSLSLITKRINQLLEPAIGKQFWVKGEVSSGRERGGNYYCELIETNNEKKIIAKISCVIWNNDFNKIRRLFQSNKIDFNAINGKIVAFLCFLQYSPQFGLSLRVIDADPSMTLGEHERKKREILERLQKEGLFEKNKGIFVPSLPIRIGLITSHESAAYNDFVRTLQSSGYGFKIYFADAMMQGDQTEYSVIRALDVICRLNVDLVFIIRGGGSKIDLHYLDNEEIARKIANFPTPVWTGIGHEIDFSVLDFVAHSHFKTPTAAAENLIARFVQMKQKIDEAVNTLSTVWSFRLKNDFDFIKRSVVGIKQGVRKLIDVNKLLLNDKKQSVQIIVKTRMSTENSKLFIFTQKITSVPIKILSKQIQKLLDVKYKFSTAASYRLEREKKILRTSLHKLSTKVQKKLSFDLLCISTFRQRIQSLSSGFIKTHHERLSSKTQTFSLKAVHNLSKKSEALLLKLNFFDISRFNKIFLNKKSQIDYKKKQLKSIYTSTFQVKCIIYKNLIGQFRLEKILKRLLIQKSNISHKRNMLRACSPEINLKKGYSICSTVDGKIIKSISGIHTNQKIKTQLSDGIIFSNAYTTEKINE